MWFKMESLTDQEIEGVWIRLKRYIPTDQIKGVTKEDQKRELDIMLRTIRTKNDTDTANMVFLRERGFHNRAIDVKKIRSELLADNVRTVEIRGQKRYVIAKGTPTFTDASGKRVKAGQFISGKTEAEAINSLEKKTSR